MKTYLGILICIGLLVAALALPWDRVYKIRGGSQRAVEEGLEGLQSEDFEERERAATTLRSLGEAARPALLAAAREGQGEVRLRAAAVLRAIQRDREPLTSRRHREFRRIVRSGIERPGVLREGTLRFRVLTIDRSHAARAAVSAVKAVEDDPLRLQRGVVLLRELGDPAGAAYLADLLARGWVLPSTLFHASEGLKRFGSPSDLPALRRAFESPDPESRRHAVRLLAVHGGMGEFSLARRAAQDMEVRVRIESAQALARLGGEGAVADLMALYQDPAAEVRAAVLRALISLPGAPAREAAVTGIADGSADVRAAALEILRARGNEGDAALAHPCLQDPSPRVRGEAVRTMAALGGRYEAARAGVRDRSPAVRRVAFLVARDLSGQDQDLVRMLAKSETDPYLVGLRDRIFGPK